jgi:uncharacterized protein (DUF169 family)
MTKYEEQSEALKKTLGLDWSPIAVTWADEPDERGTIDEQPSVCQVLERLKKENVIVNLSKENLVCPGGKHSLGLELLPFSMFAMFYTRFFHTYESQEIAEKQLKKYPEPPSGKGKYVILSRLEKAMSDPDIVVVFCIPEQAERVAGLIAFHGCEPLTFFPATNVCSVITNPLVTGKTDVSFLCRHARGVRKLWTSHNELFLSIPYADFEAAVKVIPNSGYGTVKMEFPYELLSYIHNGFLPYIHKSSSKS